MNRTKDKLNEAQYFLNRMEETQRRTDANTLSARNAFKYDLNAFLSATRSVTFAMQNDLSTTPGFTDWYTEKQNEMRHDEIMQFFVEQRNISIHQGSIQPIGRTMITITQDLEETESVSVEAVHPGQGEEQGDLQNGPALAGLPTKETIEHEWYFDRFLPNSVLTVCNVQLAKLRKLVAECETTFLITGN